MTFGIYRRYCCTNAGYCKFSESELWVDEKTYQKNRFCPGVSGQGCGKELTYWGQIDRRVHWFTACLFFMLSIYIGLQWYKYLHPPPIQGFRFAKSGPSRIQGAGKVKISVTKVNTFGLPVKILYHTQDGSAHAGIEYQRQSGELLFLPNEKEKMWSWRF